MEEEGHTERTRRSEREKICEKIEGSDTLGLGGRLKVSCAAIAMLNAQPKPHKTEIRSESNLKF